jgi:hypothetical protein
MTGPLTLTDPMKKLLKNLEYFWDFTFVYLMYNPNYLHRYHRYMFRKWGERYCSVEEYQEYLNRPDQDLEL